MRLWITLKYQLRNPIEVIVHIISWFFAFYFFDTIVNRSLDNLLYYLKDEFHVYTILGFISSYQMTKGKLEGIANTQKKWHSWIHTHENQTNVDNINETPSLDTDSSDTFKTRMKNIGLTMLQKPSVFLLHYVCWFSGFIIGILLDDPIHVEIRDEGLHNIFRIIDRVISDMSTDFYYASVACIVFAGITCFQYAVGKQNGILIEQQQWLSKYESYTDSVAEKSTIADSPSLITNDNGELLLTHNPIYSLLHISVMMVFLFLLCVQLMLITDWSGIKILSWIALMILYLH